MLKNRADRFGQITKMNDFTEQHIKPIRELEEYCKIFDQSSLRVGIDSLKEKDGDEAYLCHLNDQLIGFLSWYSSDGAEANVNAMVHPEQRRQGVYRTLLRQALTEMHSHDIQTCRFRIPADSQPGLDCICAMGASLNSSEFTMKISQLSDVRDEGSQRITLRTADDRDVEFMVRCLAEAFGDTEVWTRNYLSRTTEATRVTYIAMKGTSPIGIIRVNHLNSATAVIHDFSVLPACQGRGYGREILMKTVALLLEQKKTQIRLGVVTENRHALQLYQTVGFGIVAEYQYYVIPIHDLYGL